MTSPEQTRHKSKLEIGRGGPRLRIKRNLVENQGRINQQRRLLQRGQQEDATNMTQITQGTDLKPLFAKLTDRSATGGQQDFVGRSLHMSFSENSDSETPVQDDFKYKGSSNTRKRISRDTLRTPNPTPALSKCASKNNFDQLNDSTISAGGLSQVSSGSLSQNSSVIYDKYDKIRILSDTSSQRSSRMQHSHLNIKSRKFYHPYANQ